ncbi:hypothetical protein M1L60_24915 [Actinoplanes sp. TRM 88003]|uniref:Uncharacterized protein n=1 Tax=Paractinoplanes aksuensis TaxID=2939490 RepID=A0ABT1DSM6_9ACTN|nr:hypothetical protein [Actinoplanes aksuensis]MCO8273843.1 hypothetical protein [Actinoplanes aksuensis]
MDMAEDELTAVRRRLPRGTRVKGRVAGYPVGLGRAGLAVDLGDPVPGWVDVLQLPREPSLWPPVGRSGFFEVLQHRGHEVRLFPLDAGMRDRDNRGRRCTGPEWAELTRRRPVGARIDATVEYVYTSNREYHVRFGDWHETVEYEGSPPDVGTRVTLTVERQSEWTRTLILRPCDSRS